MKYTINDLNELFYSGGPAFRADQQAIQDIKYLIDQELLVVEQK